VLARDGRRLVEVGRQVVGRVDDVHRRARQDVRRPDEDGVADLVAEALGLGERGELLPLGLVDANFVEHARELVAVLGRVDHLGRGAKDLDVLPVELERNVVGRLAAHREHDARRALGVVDVEDRLERDVLKVELVGLVVVGRDGLRVVVDHDRLVAELAERPDRSDGAPLSKKGRKSVSERLSRRGRRRRARTSNSTEEPIR
jgi:hypothetical protein